MTLKYINRISAKIEEEEVYGQWALNLLYGEGSLSAFFYRFILPFLAHFPFFSSLYGFLQNRPASKKKILPFIQRFKLNTHEFLNSPESFNTFNEFFCRKLKPESRPIKNDPNQLIIPADARYRFFSHLNQVDGFYVKGEKFLLKTLLGNSELAQHYEMGSMLVARLCPTDYHRFHFPCCCVPSKAQLINGYLYSVNPIAFRKNIHIFTMNKRMISSLQTQKFGRILFIEVGATNVGSITQTYKEGKSYEKGNEKGFFSFGASSLILLFEPHKITFCDDLLESENQELEVRCLLGQPLAYSRK